MNYSSVEQDPIETEEKKPVQNVTWIHKNATKSNMHPDQKYIDGLLNNDPFLIEELYQRFSEKIKSMVLKNNGSETDAADIFQDVLLSLYHKAKNKDFVLTCPLEAFLYLICKNKWMNELNKRKTRKLKFIETDKYENIGEENPRQREENRLLEARRELLTEKLAKLGKSSQELIYLSWSGKSMEEVAKILNVSYGYARKKKSEAIAKLTALVRKSPNYNSLK